MENQFRYDYCEIDEGAYPEALDLWARAGLPVHPEGRDAPGTVARQAAAGHLHMAGFRCEGKLVATVVLTHDGRKGWINRLAVDPEHRRRGLARALIAEAERWFAGLGLEVYSALIHGDNRASLSLFDRAGYKDGPIVYVSKRTRADA